MPQLDIVALWKRYMWQLIRTLGEMLYGASVYEMVRDLNKERGNLERLFILVVFGGRTLQSKLAFGTFLGAAAAVSLFFGLAIIQWYSGS